MTGKYKKPAETRRDMQAICLNLTRVDILPRKCPWLERRARSLTAALEFQVACLSSLLF